MPKHAHCTSQAIPAEITSLKDDSRFPPLEHFTQSRAKARAFLASFRLPMRSAARAQLLAGGRLRRRHTMIAARGRFLYSRYAMISTSARLSLLHAQHYSSHGQPPLGADDTFSYYTRTRQVAAIRKARPASGGYFLRNAVPHDTYMTDFSFIMAFLYGHSVRCISATSTFRFWSSGDYTADWEFEPAIFILIIADHCTWFFTFELRSYCFDSRYGTLGQISKTLLWYGCSPYYLCRVSRKIWFLSWSARYFSSRYFRDIPML